ncbi:uncharacterized protein BX664DRAFT_335985 [Halteromyces radiatus]|uniref:uncharacterized protein n=1 Tax=Halteromyces radiatus TaxID=101107 RepID=UPI00221F9AD1|nr:uncharacterized protein BX664DRAFT_335985 [Halteromyces radiatus]KAI8086505.1 hypothetical protein BX664DRAFT_335985 [Halteromyces radiatus]
MKTQTLLLGEYGSSSSFYIYMIPTTLTSSSSTLDYFSIEDLYRLFFHHSPKDINSLFFTLYQQHPHKFYRDQKNRCYISKQHVLMIARSLHLFALAELCTLTHDELINRVADPLFAITNALLLRPVTPKRMDIDLEWFPLLPSNASSSSTSFFSSFLSAASRYLSPATTNTIHHHPSHKQNDHSWSRHFLPLPNIGMGRTLQAQKQQQAIIECRQRLLVYHQGLSSQSSSSVKSTPRSPTQVVNSENNNNVASTIALPVDHHRQENALQNKHPRKRKSSPISSPISLSSPSVPSNASVSKIDDQHPSSSSHQRPSSIYTRYPHHDYNNQESQHRNKKSKSSYSNLDLLATQATKMKGLPLSPEISPPPPPILSLPPISTTTSSFHSSPFIQSISLPSIRNVLSDI